MSATILAFPRRCPIQAYVRAGDGSAPFTPAWCAQHLPLIDAAMELLEADDDEFARRCLLMRDEDGRAMLDELAGQLQRLSSHIANVADALGLTAARIRDSWQHPRSIFAPCSANLLTTATSGRSHPPLKYQELRSECA